MVALGDVCMSRADSCHEYLYYTRKNATDQLQPVVPSGIIFIHVYIHTCMNILRIYYIQRKRDVFNRISLSEDKKENNES